MDGWINILTFSYSHQAHLAKTKLESEGIEVMIFNELTSQVYNINPATMGGIKLMVPEHQFPQAYQLLVEGGYIVESRESNSKFWKMLDTKTSAFPLMNKLPLEVRLLILTALLLAVILIPIMVAIQPRL